MAFIPALRKFIPFAQTAHIKLFSTKRSLFSCKYFTCLTQSWPWYQKNEGKRKTFLLGIIKVCLPRKSCCSNTKYPIALSGRGSLRNLLLWMCWRASTLRDRAPNSSQAAAFLFPLPVPELESARQSLKCLPTHTIRASQAFFLPLSPFTSFLEGKQISLHFLLCTSPYWLQKPLWSHLSWQPCLFPISKWNVPLSTLEAQAHWGWHLRISCS